MALPDSFKYIDGDDIVIADATDWTTGAHGWGAEDVQLDLTSLSSGSYRQSASIDFGVNREVLYAVQMAVEMETDPTAGETIDLYMAFSSDNSNWSAGVSGSDSAYSGYSGGTAANGVKNMLYLGSLVLDALNDLDDVQIDMAIGYFIPVQRYGVLVVGNTSSVAIHATVDQTAVRLQGMELQAQD